MDTDYIFNTNLNGDEYKVRAMRNNGEVIELTSDSEIVLEYIGNSNHVLVSTREDYNAREEKEKSVAMAYEFTGRIIGGQIIPMVVIPRNVFIDAGIKSNEDVAIVYKKDEDVFMLYSKSDHVEKIEAIEQARVANEAAREKGDK